MKHSLHRHKGSKAFVLDLPADLAMTPFELDTRKFPVVDAGNHGKRIGNMTVRQFLEKFG